jgi:hypothetical protein
MSSAGCCPEPAQRLPSRPACAMSAPFVRRGHARSHAWHRPVCWSLTRRISPLPAGGVNVSPGMAAGHGGTGRPGNRPGCDTRTGTAAR